MKLKSFGTNNFPNKMILRAPINFRNILSQLTTRLSVIFARKVIKYTWKAVWENRI